MPGASEQVAALIANATTTATQKQEEVATRLTAVFADIAKIQDLDKSRWEQTLVAVTGTVEQPRAQDDDTLESLSDTEFRNKWEFRRKAAENVLPPIFDQYFNNFFPLDESFRFAQDWVRNALEVGGSSINEEVESQIWNRDRSRILEDSRRAEEEAVTTWASRRYPIPPGAATHQLIAIRRDAQAKIAEVSRTAAIKVYDTELENVRLAVDRAISLRTAVVDNAEKYFRVQLFPRTYAHEYEQAEFAARNNFLTAARELYTTQRDTFEKFGYGRRVTTLDAERRVEEKNKDNEYAELDKRLMANLEAMKAAAQQAASALNAIHAQAGISGSDQTIENL